MTDTSRPAPDTISTLRTYVSGANALVPVPEAPSRLQATIHRLGFHHLLAGLIALVVTGGGIAWLEASPTGVAATYPAKGMAQFVEACARSAGDNVDYLDQVQACACIVGEYRSSGRSWASFTGSVKDMLGGTRSDGATYLKWVSSACKARNGIREG